MKKALLFSFLLVFCNSLFGQFGHFWNTRTQANPAFQALEHQHFANVNYRNVLPALSGSLENFTAAYGLHVKKLSGGIGFYYNRSQWVYYKSNEFRLAYNYQLQLKENLRLSFGVGAGGLFTEIDIDKMIFLPYPNETYLPTAGNALALDFGTAIVWKRLTAGIGIQNILGAKDDVARSLGRERELNLTAQYIIGKEEGLQFIPQFQFALQMNDGFTQLNTTLNGKFGYKNKFFVGAGMKFNDFSMFTAELFLKQKLRLTYSFQHTINKLSSVTGGSHEMGVCLELGKR